MRRTVLLLASIGLVVLLASGVAMAAVVQCSPTAFTCAGTNGNDTITGSPVIDDIHARGGDDIVKSLAGGDFVNGGPGNDNLYGFSAQDWIDAGPGDDNLYGGPGNDVFELDDNNAGNDRYYGADDNDTVWAGPGRDVVSAGAGNDWIDAQGFVILRDPVADQVNCGPGDDIVFFNTGQFGSARDSIASNCERRRPDY